MAQTVNYSTKCEKNALMLIAIPPGKFEMPLHEVLLAQKPRISDD